MIFSKETVNVKTASFMKILFILMNMAMLFIYCLVTHFCEIWHQRFQTATILLKLAKELHGYFFKARILFN